MVKSSEQHQLEKLLFIAFSEYWLFLELLTRDHQTCYVWRWKGNHFVSHHLKASSAGDGGGYKIGIEWGREICAHFSVAIWSLFFLKMLKTTCFYFSGKTAVLTHSGDTWWLLITGRNLCCIRLCLLYVTCTPKNIGKL